MPFRSRHKHPDAVIGGIGDDDVAGGGIDGHASWREQSPVRGKAVEAGDEGALAVEDLDAVVQGFINTRRFGDIDVAEGVHSGPRGRVELSVATASAAEPEDAGLAVKDHDVVVAGIDDDEVAGVLVHGDPLRKVERTTAEAAED